MGSKARLLRFIEKKVTQFCGKAPFTFGDLFCGTAAVSKHFKKLGHKIIANDNLVFCATLAKAALLINDEPMFSKLMDSGEVHTSTRGKLIVTPYDLALAQLNRLSGISGFMYSEYSPGGTANKEHERKYFTEKNAKKIDAIREKIYEWNEKGLLTKGENALLISDLMRASNKVANTAGTYGYFLKDWDPRTQKDLFLSRSQIIKSDKEHVVYQEDANILVEKLDCDVLYYDPPYTWRHYGAYYHILETITMWDRPNVKGKSGLRSWEENRSPYCMRGEAARALNELILNSNAKHIFLSYNSEGLISHEEILEALSQHGAPQVFEKDFIRYRSNDGGSKKGSVLERLYHVEGE